MFDGDDIVNKLSQIRIKHIDEFCKYLKPILLGFVVLYFSHTSKMVSSFPFRLLDMLDNLDVYNFLQSQHEPR